MTYIIEKQLDFYVQKQLLGCMQTHFAEKRALEVPQGRASQQLAQSSQA